MRRWQTLLVLLTATGRLAAQSTNADFSTATPGVSAFRNDSSLITQDPQRLRDDVIVGKKYTVTGLLVRPFKAIKLRKAGSAATRLLQSLNPFSREKASIERDGFMDGENTRAWSSTVGWHLGASAVPDAVTQEVGLTFLSVSRNR